jgi:hypothetical protein
MLDAFKASGHPGERKHTLQGVVRTTCSLTIVYKTIFFSGESFDGAEGNIW